MSIPFSGTLSRSAGIVSAIGKQLRFVNLKAVKRITVTFDPFDENVTATRNFLSYLSQPKILGTNPKCTIKTHVVCNRENPTIVFDLISEVQEKEQLKKIKFDASNLSVLELLQLCNKYVTTLAPVEEPVNELKTKSEKKTATKRK